MSRYQVHSPLTVTKIVHGGYGLAFDNKRTVFIEKALPGEEIIPFIYKKRKGVFFARIETFNKISPKRIKPLCPYFQDCAGCTFQNLIYDDELHIKSEVFRETLQKVGDIPVSISKIIKSPSRYYYRNKVEASIKRNREGGLDIGFHRRDDWRRVLDIDECIIANRNIQDLYAGIRDYLKKNHSLCPVEITHFSIRSNRNGDILVAFWFENAQDITGFIDLMSRFRYKKLAGMKFYNAVTEQKRATENRHIHTISERPIEDTYNNYRFTFSPESFFQVNPDITEEMVKRLRSILMELNPDIIMDLFAGNGFWGIMASEYAKKVIGVEINPLSLKEFEYNRSANNINNYEYVLSGVKQYLTEADIEPDMIIIDPPRAGVSPKIIRRIRDMKARDIIYISCNPATLARDLTELCTIYEIYDIMLFDMFPNTFHIECFLHLKIKATAITASQAISTGPTSGPVSAAFNTLHIIN